MDVCENGVCVYIVFANGVFCVLNVCMMIVSCFDVKCVVFVEIDCVDK